MVKHRDVTFTEVTIIPVGAAHERAIRRAAPPPTPSQRPRRPRAPRRVPRRPFFRREVLSGGFVG